MVGLQLAEPLPPPAPGTAVPGIEALQPPRHTSVVQIGILGLADYVAEHGGDAACSVLLDAARVIGTTIRSTDYSFQVDDHTFEIVLDDCRPEDAAMVATRLRMAIEAVRLTPGYELDVTTRVVTTVAG